MSSTLEPATTHLQTTTIAPPPVLQQYGQPQVSFLAHNPIDIVYKEPTIANRPIIYNSASGMVRTSHPMPLNIDPLSQPEQLYKVKDPLY
jgi:hypothetical protein